ncbi:MAG: hypothetical protein AAGA25_08225 [Planctomycetota bacterium]
MATAKVRGFLNKHSAIATIVAVVVLVMALAVIVLQNKKTAIFDYDVYYYDLNTQKIFVDHVSRETPFDNGAGMYQYFDGSRGSAVRAIVLTCGDPLAIKNEMTPTQIEAAGGYIGFLERMSPAMIAVQAKIAAGVELTDVDMEYELGASMVATPDELEWHDQESEEGMNILDRALAACPSGEIPKRCLP